MVALSDRNDPGIRRTELGTAPSGPFGVVPDNHTLNLRSDKHGLHLSTLSLPCHPPIWIPWSGLTFSAFGTLSFYQVTFKTPAATVPIPRRHLKRRAKDFDFQDQCRTVALREDS